VHDVPLLVEAKRGNDYAAVIVVEAPLEVRLTRLEARGVPRDDAQARIALQASDEARREVATYVIDNAGELDALEPQVDEVWARLRETADNEAANGASEASE
jgi:dephospho-CoA kinase